MKSRADKEDKRYIFYPLLNYCFYGNFFKNKELRKNIKLVNYF